VTAQEAHKTLAMALVAFQRDMPTVGKGKRAVVEHKAGGSHSYKYADLADFVEEAAPVLYAHGLSFSARPQRTDKGDYELVGMLRHVSGESDEGSLPLYGRTPQEIGSSITYGRRYLLGCLTGIVTDDDPPRGHTAGARGTSPRRRQDGREGGVDGEPHRVGPRRHAEPLRAADGAAVGCRQRRRPPELRKEPPRVNRNLYLLCFVCGFVGGGVALAIHAWLS
jgi:hypothetical protein